MKNRGDQVWKYKAEHTLFKICVVMSIKKGSLSHNAGWHLILMDCQSLVKTIAIVHFNITTAHRLHTQVHIHPQCICRSWTTYCIEKVCIYPLHCLRGKVFQRDMHTCYSCNNRHCLCTDDQMVTSYLLLWKLQGTYKHTLSICFTWQATFLLLLKIIIINSFE